MRLRTSKDLPINRRNQSLEGTKFSQQFHYHTSIYDNLHVSLLIYGTCINCLIYIFSQIPGNLCLIILHVLVCMTCHTFQYNDQNILYYILFSTARLNMSAMGKYLFIDHARLFFLSQKIGIHAMSRHYNTTIMIACFHIFKLN